MRITLFEIFGIQIKSYGLMIAIGIIVAAMLFINKGKKKNYDEDSLLNLIIFCSYRWSSWWKSFIYNNRI